MSGIQILFRIVIISIVLVALILFGLVMIPPKAASAVDEVLALIPPIWVDEGSCMFYCYATQERKAINLIAAGSENISDEFLDIEELDYTQAVTLPSFFSCNYQLLDVATHVVELSKWNSSRPLMFIDNVDINFETTEDKSIMVYKWDGPIGVGLPEDRLTFRQALTEETDLFDYEADPLYLELLETFSALAFPRLYAAITIISTIVSLFVDEDEEVNWLVHDFVNNYSIYYNELDPFSSSWQFEHMDGWRIVGIQIEEGNWSHNGLEVQPTFEVLAPKGRVVREQEGLEGYHVSLGGIFNIMRGTFGEPFIDRGDEQLGTFTEYAKSFKGEVTYPRYFENATRVLYDCVSDETGRGCDNGTLNSFRYLCGVDRFLEGYPYVNCMNNLKLRDKINPAEMQFLYREGKDIYNGFYCKKPGDACHLEEYDYDKCNPSWATMYYHKGRCEDFAMLYYTLFKTLGLPETMGNEVSELSVNLTFSHFTMPCSCRAIVKNCNAKTLQCDGESCSLYGTEVSCPGTGTTYHECQDKGSEVFCALEEQVCDYVLITSFEEKMAAAPQWVTVHPGDVGGTFNACPDTMQLYPSWNSSDALGVDSPIRGKMNGAVYELRIGDTFFNVVQDFNSSSDYYYPVYLHKNFDEEYDYYTSDSAKTGFGSVSCSGGFSCDFCKLYLQSGGLSAADVLDCEKFIPNPAGFRENVTYWCGVELGG